MKFYVNIFIWPFFQAAAAAAAAAAAVVGSSGSGAGVNFTNFFFNGNCPKKAKPFHCYHKSV